MIGRLNLIELSLDEFRFGDSPRRSPIVVVVRVDGDDCPTSSDYSRRQGKAPMSMSLFEDDDDRAGPRRFTIAGCAAGPALAR